MAAIEIAPGRITHFDLTGPDGAPVVLLVAGPGASRRYWIPTVDGLAPTFRVLTFDCRDVGENDVEDATPYTMHLALRHPDVVDRLVLVATTPAAGAAYGTPNVPPTADEWIEDPVERLRLLLSALVAPGYYDGRTAQLDADAECNRGNRMTCEGLARQFGAGDTHDVRGSLHEIRSATLLVAGALDPRAKVSKVYASGRDRRTHPAVEDDHLPGGRTLPLLEAPEQFHADLLAFLTTAEPLTSG